MWCTVRFSSCPLLFLLYVNDFNNCSDLFSVHPFAHASNLFLADSSLESLEISVNHELVYVQNWLCANKLSLNIDKTNFVLFHLVQKKKVTKAISIKANQESIKQKDRIKYQGIIPDSHLDFKLSKKISRGIGILAKLRHYDPPSVLKHLYYSLVYPFLT